MSLRMTPWYATCAAATLILVRTALASDGPQFESPPVRPIELSFDQRQLFAVHQADHRFLVFDLTQGDLPVRVSELMVGLEPVTVRQRTESEVWVVNHLSDSISIIDLASMQVVRTLLVGDEPTDVVFAGVPERAFVCVSQEDLIRVYDPANPTAVSQEIPLDQSDPIALGLSPDRSTVYVAAFDSGNRTSVVPFLDVESGGGPPPPDPPMLPDLPPAPRAALIVKHDGTAWRDEAGTSWNEYLHYTLLDHDVLGIDAQTLTIDRVFTNVGTNLLGLAVSPATGALYVSNQEAFNEVRFLQHLKGRFLHNRVTVIDPSSATVTPRHLNEHIHYDVPLGSPAERALSLSLPGALAVSDDGANVYVAAFGSAKVGVLDAAGGVVRRIQVGDGPIGLALDESRGRLYVLRRVPGALAVVDLGDDSVLQVGLGFDPTPAEIHAGRQRFYSGQASSAHGDLSCASCHINGAMDGIAWDLGDPEGVFDPGWGGEFSGFHPMKGPLVTQALKGLTDTEPFHWRGDRPTLRDFNPAFVDLMGMEQPLDESEFAEMESFMFSLQYPPNPYRNLDGSIPRVAIGPNPRRGEYLFLNGPLVKGAGECHGCHTLPTTQNGLIIQDDFLLQDQDMVVPQLRNLYEKTRFDRTAQTNVRGFGFTHDGAIDGLVEFMRSPRFFFEGGDPEREDVAAFLFTMDTGTHAAVGAQWTMDGGNEAAGRDRVDTLMGIADLGPIGLVAKGKDSSGDARGWVYGMGLFQPDRMLESPTSLNDLLDIAAIGREITFTGVYPGSETRLGIDRDLDGFFDRDEIDAGSDPGDPGSTPETVGVPGTPDDLVSPWLDPPWPNPATRAARVAYRLPRVEAVTISVHDVAGRRVRTLLDEKFAAVERTDLVWDLRSDAGESVAAGLYFVRLVASDAVRTQRIVVQR